MIVESWNRGVRCCCFVVALLVLCAVVFCDVLRFCFRLLCDIFHLLLLLLLLLLFCLFLFICLFVVDVVVFEFQLHRSHQDLFALYH